MPFSPGSARGSSLTRLHSVRLAPGESWAELRARADVWIPLAAHVLDREGWGLAPDVFLGRGGSYPAVISGDLVVKFFGFAGEWRATWVNERRAHDRLALDERILAPRLLGSGELFPGHGQTVPYVLLTRVPGKCWSDTPLTFEDRLSVAAELGQQLRRVHALPADGLPNIDAWRGGSVADGARQGAFPAELVESVDAWLGTIPVAAPVFVHSDLFVRHPFVSNGHLSGIIDWGDAMAADPHVELAKIHLDVFEGDKRLLRAFLDAYEWPIDAEFARRSMAMALRRHAQILGQHGGGDVFYRLPELIAGKRVDNLDVLAHELFGI